MIFQTWHSFGFVVTFVALQWSREQFFGLGWIRFRYCACLLQLVNKTFEKNECISDNNNNQIQFVFRMKALQSWVMKKIVLNEFQCFFVFKNVESKSVEITCKCNCCILGSAWNPILNSSTFRLFNSITFTAIKCISCSKSM